MSVSEIEEAVRARLHAELDPLLPDAAARRLLLGSIADATRHRASGRGLDRPGRRGLASVLVAAIVVVLVGGTLAVSLAFRHRTVTAGHPAGAAATGPIVHTSPRPLVLPCDGDVLTLSRYDQTTKTGAVGGDITLRNIGSVACTMDGYVDLQGLIGGQVVQLGVTHSIAGVLLNNSAHRLPGAEIVTVQPGYYAFVAFESSDVGAKPTTCSSPTALLMTPPQGHRYAVLASWPTPLCTNHGVALWIDEAPVSATPYFGQVGSPSPAG